ncbi:hypothetical protein A3D05_00955 [Candidatus Gottesmanbacteria bacterium RIFCSPHIGHO2_02_FULL_40_24]|uniref:2-oxoacid:ferredoxin oxidoreductase subunit alpha n=1 Tax=Candidatus Gottesmanbacteria bacterium RIFCSPHIGHO2_01_FULL_40_15 TaxID=1798376 RepID=A0A1F5Z020_9BACT|nr:MAG: hypothetical protein A2777_05115 [Candidatus Gottesmanbacteria bacterium RIFCSPHIGHO2_01_FULL_40_15]OGG18306.1 MAG: hypothetical protein A3D05_00955 [Candidatus Gottesmanbacteria bacterium RIFCSPHIGHO2_02_FULL_40_24]OGG24863.1 MAG: hypothetical protein A3E42_02040 [Candidatus Gottesmanbacteria bacterium RIFCSPHIGHO2_12_FULL_40_13]OGG33700.1 MAG: hypothetical protein A3I80_05165 [Candidatus Gottesmanbacteria bacterium RIFCSPLOWO2_02_FULL_40_10]
MVDITVKIGGEAGFGIMTTGLLLGKIATRSGYHAFEYSEYPSLIRGGHNVIEVRISDSEIYSQKSKVDILLCLNLETFNLHASEVKDGGVIVYDEEKIAQDKIKKTAGNISFVHVPFNRILQEQKLPTVMLNNIALGVLMHLLGADLEILNNLIEENFARKSREIIDKNQTAAKVGFEVSQKSLPQGSSVKLTPLKDALPKMYISGNEMIGLASIAAGCRFYVAYPMTPTSAVLHYLAAKSGNSGMVVKHAEDEISVINMALGSAFAGVRSMVGTSGGGFALMVESVSLAGITETPIVIVMGQRPGPATGMPTWTEQGDLLFILHSGHGEFPKILLAPGDMEEVYKLTLEAFNLADKYQTPVFIIVDKYIQEGHQSVDKSKISEFKYPVDRGKLLSQEDLLKISAYKRYLDSPDGISPRAIPGMENSLHQANSYEHLEDGHTTEDAGERSKQVEKRNRKAATYLKQDFQMPRIYGDDNAPLTLISWGSMKAPVLQAMKESASHKFNLLHFNRLWPLDREKLKLLLSGLKKTLLVENNSQGQLGQLLTMATGVEFDEKLLKFTGRPIYPEEIIAKVNSIT